MVLTSLFIRRTCHRFAIWQALVQRAQLSISVGPELVEGLFFLHAASERRAVLRPAQNERVGILVTVTIFLNLRIAICGESKRNANRGASKNDDTHASHHHPHTRP